MQTLQYVIIQAGTLVLLVASGKAVFGVVSPLSADSRENKTFAVRHKDDFTNNLLVLLCRLNEDWILGIVLRGDQFKKERGISFAFYP